ncbi:MAG TPA: hypothetical protein VN665_03110 [Candidatus Paceibacterota bacterium]|nr:hypothetical protein [Candidatus Paceibacterota bacterium]
MTHRTKPRTTLEANPDVSHLHARMATGQVKPEARDEMEQFELFNRVAEDEGHFGHRPRYD